MTNDYRMINFDERFFAPFNCVGAHMKKMFLLCGYTKKKLKFTGSFIYIPMESLRSNWSSRIYPAIFVRADLHGTIFVACDQLTTAFNTNSVTIVVYVGENVIASLKHSVRGVALNYQTITMDPFK